MKPLDSKKDYQDYVNKKSPNSPIWKNCFNAFWVGGLICSLGQIIMDICKYRGLSQEISGTIVSLFLNSVMSFLAYIFPKYSNQIILWQLGTLYVRNILDIFIIILLALISLLVLIKYSSVLDIMTFGDDTSLSLGVDAKKMRIFFILISSFITAVLVAFTGIIGFVDLVSPHIARKIFGAKHIIVLPMSALLGGILLNFSDIFSRIIVQGSNIPIGIVTAVIGAPFFLYIFINDKKY